MIICFILIKETWKSYSYECFKAVKIPTNNLFIQFIKSISIQKTAGQNKSYV